MAVTDEAQGTVGVIYGRYSAGPTQTDQSLEGQLRDCYAYAKSHGIHVIHEYLDRHISGKEAESRPQFQKMITDSKRKKFNVVLVWKLDRFARNRYDSARYKAALKKNNVRVISVMEPISEGPEGIILESVLEGFAEYFSADLSQKVKRGLRESALKCKCIGRPPIGYKKGPNAEFLIDEESVPYVHKIFSMFIAGEPYQKIADTVNAMGCRSSRGNPLRYSSIAKVLKCEKYIGVYESHGVRIVGGVPAIVSKEEWNAAQERLALSAKGEYSYRNNGASAKQCYLLAGKVFCGECKSPMVGDTTMKKYPSGHQERYSYYSCSRRKCNRRSGGRTPRSERCKKKPIRKDELEGIVKERTRFFLSQPDVLEVIHRACEEIEHNQETREAEVMAIKSQLNKVQGKIDNILKAIEEGVYTPSVTVRLKELEAQKSQMEEELRQRFAPEKMSEQMIWFLSTYIPSDSDTEEYWKDVFSIFLDSVVCFDNGKVVITFNLFDDDPLLKNSVKKEVECVLSAECAEVRANDSQAYIHEIGSKFCDKAEFRAFLFDNRLFYVNHKLAVVTTLHE